MKVCALTDLLPHRPPMLWLDELISHDEQHSRCRVTVRADHPFFRDGELDVSVSIEWMAQTVGALVGLRDVALGQPPRIGYLIAVPEATFEIHAFALGDTLEIEATRIWGDDLLASFTCQVYRQGKSVARAQLSVYRDAKQEG
jgi:predicted hotdog family 3-hydroxylacyl-ACP dehydratase